MEKKLNLRRKVSGIVALVLVAALLVAGTFAWAKQQTAQNEFSGDETPEANLIDEFDPDEFDGDIDFPIWTKLVAVENTGNLDLYVRVKLSEFMGYTNGTDVYESFLKDGGIATYNGSDPEYTVSDDAWTDYAQDSDFREYWTLVFGEDVYFGLEAWVDAGLPADSWVLLSDGYFYYTSRLDRADGTVATVTSYLLEQVKKIELIEQDYYYAINVEMDVVTDYDVQKWISGGVADHGPMGEPIDYGTGLHLIKNADAVWLLEYLNPANTIEPVETQTP